MPREGRSDIDFDEISDHRGNTCACTARCNLLDGGAKYGCERIAARAGNGIPGDLCSVLHAAGNETSTKEKNDCCGGWKTID